MGTFNAVKATYAKLRSGDWGVRIEARINTKPNPGDEVLVRKASGETKTEKVDAVLWSGGGVHLCSIRRSGAAPSTSGGDRCAECLRAVGVVECSDSSGIRAKCCRRCASLSQYERSFA